MTRARHILLLLLLLLGLAPAALAQDNEPRVSVRLVPERTEVTGGDIILVAVEQVIEPGWHTYWSNPGDSGAAPVLTWSLPAGYEAGSLLYPVPQKMMNGPLVSYGYEGRAVLLQEIIVPATLPEGPQDLRLDLEILVCAAEICIPENGTYELTLNTGMGENNSDFIDEAYSHMPLSIDWNGQFYEENGELVVTLDILSPGFMQSLSTGTDYAIAPLEWGVVNNAASASIVTTIDSFTLRQARGDRPLSGIEALDFVFLYRDAQGEPQNMRFTVSPGANPAMAQTSGGHSFLATALLFALLGGLILNLMPCVFPVLSLKALKLCRLSGKGLAHARLHSLLYTAGILLSFAALAGALLMAREAGLQIGWGFHLQNPAFVMILTYLLFLIGLNLAGFFEIPARLANIGSRFAEGEGAAASFFTGVLAAIVATPCTAPFMGVAMGFALTQPAAVTLLVFLMLGLGLALPYILLSVIPALRNALPRPGAWMDVFRQFLAFPMFASAAWLFHVYTLQAGPAGLMTGLAGLVALAFALWLLRQGPRWLRLLSVLALLAALPPLFVNRVPGPAMDHSGWTMYSADTFAALERGDAPLFVNMTAAWCLTCKVNERVALETDAARALFEKHKVTTVKGDWTNRDPDITAYLAGYGRNGVPLYVYYGPRDEETRRRPQPVVLPQILTPGILADTIERK